MYVCTSQELLYSGSGGLEPSLKLPCLLLHPGQLSLQEREERERREGEEEEEEGEGEGEGEKKELNFWRVCHSVQ